MKRENCISWDEYFMGISVLSSMRSKDPNTQVGACLVNKNKRVIGIGYNGAPNGFLDEDFPWKRDGNHLETKYYFVVHAERNAILNCYCDKLELVGSTLYVTLFPCNECAKEIVQCGIKEVVYMNDKYADFDETIAAKKIFDQCGVKYRLFESTNEEIRIPLK